jgi:hypothetical protein
MLFLSLLCSAAGAGEGHYFGVVESVDGGHLVVRTMKHSTGSWNIDSHTRIEGSIARYDWVSVELGRGSRIAWLRFEERPTSHTGVVREVHNRVLSVHSGRELERWNITDATLGETAVAERDEISVKVYGNHNLAEITILRHGVR